MSVLVLQHVPFEGPDACAEWFLAAGHAVSIVALYRGDPLPTVASASFVLVMGGPMSVNDEAEFPWLVEEKRFVRAAVEAGIPVLGICLGAQLLAAAFGARVYPNPVKEIGWWPVEGVDHGDPGAFRFPRAFTPLHWHGETFDLPRGAVHLARSTACANQAFQLGPRAIGVQFHLESTGAGLRGMVAHGRHELAPGPYIQGEAELLDDDASRHADANRILDSLLRYLLRLA